MNQSPLNLNTYQLLEYSIKPDPDYVGINSDEYPDIAGAELSTKIGAGKSPDEDTRDFAVKIALELKPQEKGSYPYRILIEIVGNFTVLEDIDRPDFDRQEFVLINGSTMLYGILREMILSMTGRFPSGPVMLPTVNFLDMKNK